MTDPIKHIGLFHQNYEQGVKLCNSILETLEKMVKNKWYHKQKVFVLSNLENINLHKSATPKQIEALIRAKNIVEAWYSVGRQGR